MGYENSLSMAIAQVHASYMAAQSLLRDQTHIPSEYDIRMLEELRLVMGNRCNQLSYIIACLKKRK